MNKKGEKLISVYWFAILFIVAAGVVYMVISFYGEPYDVRKAEAEILAEKVANCLTEGPYLKEEIFEEDFNENLIEHCRLNFEVEDVFDWKQEGQYYFEFGVYSFDSKEEIVFGFAGNNNLKSDCRLEGKGFPVCFEKSFYSLDRENKQYEVKVMSSVKKVEKNVY
ncbi:MAG: hypothetical protein WDZ62_01005 [Candidatus Pacearchaeota archaeon]